MIFSSSLLIINQNTHILLSAITRRTQSVVQIGHFVTEVRYAHNLKCSLVASQVEIAMVLLY